MDSKAKIDIALRAALLARDVLDMLNVPNKAMAKMLLANIVCRARELDRTIDSLPED